MSGAAKSLLPGGRWHFQHGPIDLVIGAEGDADVLAAAHAAAWQRFDGLLAELVAELPLLRQPVVAEGGNNPLQGPVARRMWAACAPLREAAQGYLTPMAAVAGAVAQEIVAAYQRPGITRAWVNNGGDIALHLAAGEQATVGLFADLARFDAGELQRTAAGQLRTDGQFTVHAREAVRGVATSGWRGRSHSRGIADSVTVLAATAAQADAAATVVANAVDVDDAAIRRAPAHTLRDDSDLGGLLVTVDVPPLAAAQVQKALERGLACAQALQARGLIHAAVLVCQGSLARLPAAQPLEWVAELVQ